MKLLVLISIVITLNSCDAQTKKGNKTQKHIDMKTQEQTRDTLDIETYKLNEKEWEYNFIGIDSIKYRQVASRNTNREIVSYDEYRTPPLPDLRKTGVAYNSTGYSTIRGKLLLDLPIGIWEYWDKDGNYTTVDEDKKFGKFSYMQVVDFIEKEGHLDKETGKGIDHVRLYFESTPTLGGKIWTIIVNTGYSDIETYKLDGDTGEVLNHIKEPGGIE